MIRILVTLMLLAHPLLADWVLIQNTRLHEQVGVDIRTIDLADASPITNPDGRDFLAAHPVPTRFPAVYNREHGEWIEYSGDLAADKAAVMERVATRPETLEQLLFRITATQVLAANDLAPEEVLVLAEAFRPWRVGIAVEAGHFYRYEGEPYKVIQPHTTQADWTPPLTPALWQPILPVGDSGYPPWVEPAGAHDAYAIGDRVEHAGSVWESTIAANTVEPGTHPGFDWWVEVN